MIDYDENENLRNQLIWSPKKIQKAKPEEIFKLLKDYTQFLKEIIKDKREQSSKEHFNMDMQQILIEWGKWSRELNIIVRRRVKECDLFIENDEIRFEGKKLSTCFLFWTKCNRFLEGICHQEIWRHTAAILNLINELEVVEKYFAEMEMVLTPKPVNLGELK